MFLSYDQDQNFLLPPNFKQFLGEWHEAIILSELIDDLDLDKLIQQYIQDGKGRPAFHPRMLLKVLFYGYMNQTFSSRKLANKLTCDLGFMYLAGNNQPDFRTINRFRKEKGKILEDIFVQIVLKAKDLGLIKFGTVSLDGTKIYANASNDNNYEVEKLDKKIKKLFDEASKIDDLEDEEYGDSDGNEVPQELQTKEGRNAKKKEIEEQRKQAELTKDVVQQEIEIKKEQGINQSRINMTDKDARLMMMKRKDWGTGYNPQNLTENQFILTTTVPNSASDVDELIPILKKFYEKYQCFPKNQNADAGYASEQNYQFLENNNINSYIPHQAFKIDIDNYIYDEINDTFTDKQGNTFKLKQNIKKTTGGIQGKKLSLEDIKSKIYVSTINGVRKFMHVNYDCRNIAKRNDKRLYSKEGREIYKKRSGCVETVFGNIKTNLGFERFRLRGFEGVQIERNLISLAHNLKKLIRFELAC